MAALNSEEKAVGVIVSCLLERLRGGVRGRNGWGEHVECQWGKEDRETDRECLTRVEQTDQDLSRGIGTTS
jgi:hypothetical protein